MDMRRLEVFCRVLELHSFTKAGQAVYLSQPTVSEHIRGLEEMLGEKLVDRLGREVLPTPAGKILYRYARNIIQLRDEAIQALKQFKGSLAGQLVIGASTIPGTYILPEFIGSFKVKHSGIQLSLKIADTADIVKGLLDANLELGLVGSKWKDARLELEEIFSDELVLTVYPEHPWAQRDQVDLPELGGQPFILRERGSGTRMVMTQILERHGFDMSRLAVVAEMGSTEAVRQGIKARIGMSILSRRAVAEDLLHHSLVTVELKGVQFSRPFYLIRRRNRQASPLCLAFLEHLHSVCPLRHEDCSH